MAKLKALRQMPVAKSKTSTTRKPPLKQQEIVLPAVHPNAGIAAEYQRRLEALTKAMAKSFLYWISAAYKANEPVIAQDELPAAALRRVIRKLGRQWQKNFDAAAPELAAYFAQAVSARSDAQLKSILRRAGISVKFNRDRATGDVFSAAVNENVSLIKSIPQKYLTDVEGMVMRSIQKGGDLGTLTGELQKAYGITFRRAAFIAKDQNAKASAMLTRVRQVKLGITRAIWVHSAGGKTPRPTHIAAGARKQEYDTSVGWYDPHEEKYIFPGELPNCRCVSKPIIVGFE